MHGSAITAACVINGSNDHISHTVTVQISQRRHRTPEVVIGVEIRSAVCAARDFQCARDDTVARFRDRGNVILHLAVRRRASGIGRRRVGAQTEPSVGRACEACWHGRERQRHDTLVGSVRHGDRRAFGSVVEHTVGVVVDPAIERGGRAGRVGDDHVHRWSRADGQRQIRERVVQAVLVIG